MTLNFLERDYFRVGSVCLKINVKVEHDHEYPLSRKALKASRLLHPLSSLANGKANCKISSRRMTSCLFISKSEEKSSRWLVLWCVKSWTLGMTHEKTWKSCCRSVLPDNHYVFSASLSDRLLVRTFAPIGHQAHKHGSSFNTAVRNLLHFVLLGDGADKRPGNPHGHWFTRLVVHRITSVNSWAMADHGSILGKYAKILELLFNSKFFIPSRALSRITRWVKSSLILSG